MLCQKLLVKHQMISPYIAVTTALTLPLLSIGGAGVISVSSHIIGNEMKTMIRNFKSGNLQEAAAAHRSLLPVFKGLFTSPNPTPVKAALGLKGIEVGGVVYH